MAEYLLSDCAIFVVIDIDMGKVDALKEKDGLDQIRYVTPDEIYVAEADIFYPVSWKG